MRYRIRWKTMLKLVVGFSVFYVCISSLYRAGTRVVGIVASKRFRGSLLHRDSNLVNPYEQIPAKRCTNKTTSEFFTMPSLSGSTVITRSDTTWLRGSDNTCAGDDSFVKTRLFSAAGDVTIFVHPEWTDRFVSATVIGGGVWEAPTVNKFVGLLRDDCSLDFVDVGGNIGVYGLSIANLRRNVVFVEPLLTNVRKLCASITAGAFRDAYVVHNAASSTRTTVGFGTYAGNVGGTFITNVTSRSEETVRTILLDDLLEVFRFRRVAMKMDVEGHEAHVLQGSERFFREVDVRYLLIEWNSHRNQTTGRSILDFLRRHGLTPYDAGTDDPLVLSNSGNWPSHVFWMK